MSSPFLTQNMSTCMPTPTIPIISLQTPETHEEWEQVARLFEKRWNFPNCLGGLDGKHVKIYPPANSGSLYHNFKGGFSVVLMALVDANLEFIYVDAGQCGRHADGGIWRNCALNQRIEQGVAHIPPPRELPGTDLKSPYVIVGDGAFPLTEHLQHGGAGDGVQLSTQPSASRQRERVRRDVEPLPLPPGQHAAGPGRRH